MHPALAKKSLNEQVQEYRWWHTIDLGGGVITPGTKSAEIMRQEAEAIFSRIDLRGKTVLDIGAWNGGFSVEAARRGAKKVVGLDHRTWNHPIFKGRETFDLVVKTTGLNIHPADVDLDQAGVSLQHLGQFDIVLYLGVFYHLKDPIAATREICSLTRQTLVLETHIEQLQDERPLMVFYPGAELANDPNNWWGPNTACITALLKHFGFRHIDVTQGSSQKRQIFHAYR